MRYHPEYGSPARTSAFALVLALVFMSFILLLIIGLGTLTSIESQSANTARKQTEARSNALLALSVALGELQKHTGPDQRITTPANIQAVSNGEEVPYWTGVWRQSPDTENRLPENTTWLVSGNETGINLTPPDLPPAAYDSSTNRVWLVGGGSSDDTSKYIQLPLQPVTATDGNITGNYAWWAGDEGAKANIALVDPIGTRPAEEKVYSFITAQRVGAEHINDLRDHYPVNDPRLSRLLSMELFPMVAANETAQEVLELAQRSLFHDTTIHSAGLLTNTASGGVKRDLTAWLKGSSSTNAPADDDFLFPPVDGDETGVPTWGLIRSFADLRDDGQPLVPRPQSLTEQGIFPVITFANLGFDVSAVGQGSPLQVQLFPLIVLWNPSSMPLDAAQYEVGMGVSNPTNRAIQFRVNGELKTTLHLSRGTIDDASAPIGMFRFTIDAPAIEPGESLVFSLADGEYAQEYTPGQNVMVADSSLPGGNFVYMTPTASSAQVTYHQNEEGEYEPLDVDWTFVAGGGRLSAALRLKPGAPDSPTGFDYGADTLHLVDSVGYSPATAPRTTQINIDSEGFVTTYTIGMEIAMSGIPNNAKVPWISHHNMRAPYTTRFRRDSSHNPAYGGSNSATNGRLTAPAPPDANRPYWRASTGIQVNAPGGTPINVVLAEYLPEDVPLFSLAQLQHANLSIYSNYPTYAVGNALAPYRIPLDSTTDTGGTYSAGISRSYDVSYLLNEALWDGYFFSTSPETLSASDLDSGYSLPNSRLKPLADADATLLAGASSFDSAATQLMVDGAFNINSTSVNAWSAILASLNNLPYDPVAQSSGSGLENPFSRYTTPTENPNGFWEKTYRTLSEDQIDSLAGYIVEEIKERGPFLSLGDFINRRLGDNSPLSFKGTLQAALDKQSSSDTPLSLRVNADPLVASGNISGSGANGIANYFLQQLQSGLTPEHPAVSRFAYAPGYLTQADILTALGSTLSAKSDTFVIRTYGDVINPITGEMEARVWCEAVVQRAPNYIDPSLLPWEMPSPGSVNEQFGRQYKIVSLRWLSEDEV